MGALSRAFPPELVDQVVATTDTREQRKRLLPARLMVYFVLALWLRHWAPGQARRHTSITPRYWAPNSESRFLNSSSADSRVGAV